ncbi:MAG: cob(I)yrinic acid a,c-diamide adenosyltransferase [Cyclobacteriaceae bacterium]|nr:cob(I)yrinic acid a,c-diamide adenosyltransferase [Cyclobacteriaceae bacterium]
MKIYTKTGDKGQTSLLGGTRVSKSDDRIEAYGTIDELNSYIGLIRDTQTDSLRREILKEIQDRLFTIGSHLALDKESKKDKLPDLHESDVELLEKQMDEMDEVLPEMRSFVLPGGHVHVSYCHIARCVCRRAERLTIRLAEAADIEPIIIRYLNRLSDYLFVLGRKLAMELGVGEVPWNARF